VVVRRLPKLVVGVQFIVLSRPLKWKRLEYWTSIEADQSGREESMGRNDRMAAPDGIISRMREPSICGEDNRAKSPAEHRG
jgi:hypothetical protein